MKKAIYVKAAEEKRLSDLLQYLLSKSFTMHYQDRTTLFYNDVRLHNVFAIDGNSDTPSSTIGNLIYYLCRPSIKQKL